MEWKRLEKAINLRDSGRVEDALEELRAMTKCASDKDEKASLLLSQITCFILLGKPDEAEAILKRVSELGPDNPEVRLNYDQQEAYTLAAQGKFEQALTKFDALLRDFPQVTQDKYRFLWEDIQQRRAFALVDLGRPADALPLLEQAISYKCDEQKDEQLIHVYLGTCYYQLGQYERAKEQFRHAIALGRNNRLEFEARYRLAVVHWGEGALAQAKFHLEHIVGVLGSPNEPEIPRKKVYELLSKTCRYLGESANALLYSELARLPDGPNLVR